MFSIKVIIIFSSLKFEYLLNLGTLKEKRTFEFESILIEVIGGPHVTIIADKLDSVDSVWEQAWCSCLPPFSCCILLRCHLAVTLQSACQLKMEGMVKGRFACQIYLYDVIRHLNLQRYSLLTTSVLQCKVHTPNLFSILSRFMRIFSRSCVGLSGKLPISYLFQIGQL